MRCQGNIARRREDGENRMRNNKVMKKRSNGVRKENAEKAAE